MSVLKSKRNESRVEYVATADKIYSETIQFLSKLSARYSRLLAPDTIHLASEVVSYAKKADDAYPSDIVRLDLRERHLLNARGALKSLDIALYHCYDVMMMNPESCFEAKSGKQNEASKAINKLDKMAQSLGTLIDKEGVLLTGVLKSDSERRKKLTK